MAVISAIGTYLPPWVVGKRRVAGPDEDALTMAVAAGRAADPGATASRVVLVSRDFPLLEGGNAAVLLAGLSLSPATVVAEVLGGAAAVVDQIALAEASTLVIAADHNARSSAAAAVLTGTDGEAPSLSPVSRNVRSLPLIARGADGVRHVYVDPRLQREVGMSETLARLDLAGDDNVVSVLAGVAAAQLGNRFDTSSAAADSTESAAAVIRLLADALEARRSGLVIGFDQSTAAMARLDAGTSDVRIARDEVDAAELPKTTVADGNGIPISLPAYSRAFEPKLYWEAAVFEESKGIDSTPVFPPRMRTNDAGTLVSDYTRVPLPRSGSVYTLSTIRIPVPDLPSPYSLAIIALDGSPLRVLLKVTGVPAGEVHIGQPGAVVLRRIALRSGIPDYGYMFWPGKLPVSQEVPA
ncbi:OB-fold domain-containing protein [Mycobacterium sp. NBC_00419]|uniref:OB-fold domain-containing protein n=1 Tax=Mycobacterium sp. NBC_00419 TaxID=2975989 RepID=UPI002E1D2F25